MDLSDCSRLLYHSTHCLIPPQKQLVTNLYTDQSHLVLKIGQDVSNLKNFFQHDVKYLPSGTSHVFDYVNVFTCSSLYTYIKGFPPHRICIQPDLRNISVLFSPLCSSKLSFSSQSRHSVSVVSTVTKSYSCGLTIAPRGIPTVCIHTSSSPAHKNG